MTGIRLPGTAERVDRKTSIVSSALAVGVLVAGAAGLAAAPSTEPLEKRTRFMMGTYVTLYVGGPAEQAARAAELALDRMEEVDRKFNVLSPESPLYAFNHDGTPVSDPEILEVVAAALEMSQVTGGAFDPTVAPLIELWGFYGDSPHLPADDEIRVCLDRVGHEFVRIEGGLLTKTKEGVEIDLGAIAKGHAVAQGADVLRREGITSALIDAGGDVYALGDRGGRRWKVGIRSPRGEDLLGYLEVRDLAIMGSGDYERFFIHEGKRYHHIFDPTTGYPAEGLTGVTAITADPMMADAWATALFVLGPDAGLPIVERTSGLDAIMVTESGEVLYSSGMPTELRPVPGQE